MTTPRNPDDGTALTPEQASESQTKPKRRAAKKKAESSTLAQGEGLGVVATPATEAELEEQSMSGMTISPAAKLAVAVAATAVLGITAGLGVVLMQQSEPLPNVVQPVPTSSATAAPGGANAVDNGEVASFDDELRDWNLKAAGSISPLISQLARAPRNTLGGQVTLCMEQRTFLQAVLDLPSPPNKSVEPSFERWRNAVRDTLDGCTERTPSGDDAADIARIVREMKETEAYFASFLAAQQPFLDVQFQANPEAFEK